MPYLKPRFLPGFLAKGKCLPVEMLLAGHAVVYEQSGAEYGPFSKEQLLAFQKEAECAPKPSLSQPMLMYTCRLARRGIWKDGPLKETPAEYKKRYAGEAVVKKGEAAPMFTPNGVAAKAKRVRKSGLQGLVSKVLKR